MSADRAWAAVLEGGWVLVGVHASGHARSLVFRPAKRRLGTPEGLTRREVRAIAGASNGEGMEAIGASLGVSTATAARAVRSGMKKLGIATLVDLARWLGPSLPKQ